MRPRLLNDLERVSTDESSTVQVVVSGKVVSPLLQVHPALSASFPFFSGHLPGSLYFSTLSTYLKTSSLKNISWVTLSILLDHREGKEKWQSGLMALANKRDRLPLMKLLSNKIFRQGALGAGSPLESGQFHSFSSLCQTSLAEHRPRLTKNKAR